MFNGLLVVVTVSAVGFPHGVDSVYVLVGVHVSCAGSEDYCLVGSR